MPVKKISRRTRHVARGNPRFVRRKASGRIQTNVSQKRSLAADRRQSAKTTVRSGQGDRGDTKSRRRKRGLAFGVFS